MDISLYARVIWRFRFLVALGFVAACGLATLAVAQVDFKGGTPTLTYRKHELWMGSQKLLITQKGVPWGRLSLPTTSGNTQSSSRSGQVFADPSRLASLAPFYAQLANSAAIQRFFPIGSVKATPVVDNSTAYANVLPILQFNAFAFTPQKAESLAQSAARLFKNYVTKQQASASIPQGQRVLLQPLTDTMPPLLVQPRKKSLAIVAFVTIMIATLGLAFILENLRPRERTIVEVAADEPDRRVALERTA